jgi:hypothetical protein
MAVIRPFNPPVLTPQTAPKPAPAAAQTRGAAEARAAQRAFFQQALGDPTPVRAAPAPAPPAAAQAPGIQVSREVRRPIPEEPPAQIKRPGSFVDIKV